MNAMHACDTLDFYRYRVLSGLAQAYTETIIRLHYQVSVRLIRSSIGECE